jgi:hypothetical protein
MFVGNIDYEEQEEQETSASDMFMENEDEVIPLLVQEYQESEYFSESHKATSRSQCDLCFYEAHVCSFSATRT